MWCLDMHTGSPNGGAGAFSVDGEFVILGLLLSADFVVVDFVVGLQYAWVRWLVGILWRLYNS